MRSYALHLVFGAGVAVGALAASTTLFRAGPASGVQMLRWTLPWIGVAEFAFALFAWVGLRNDGWRVRPKVPTYRHRRRILTGPSYEQLRAASRRAGRWHSSDVSSWLDGPAQ
ncbi:MAG: hypothetical protein ACR2LJ_11875 [Acidimicrobiales bacterium]